MPRKSIGENPLSSVPGEGRKLFENSKKPSATSGKRRKEQLMIGLRQR